MTVLNPTLGFPAWRFEKGIGNPQGIWPWGPAGFDYRHSGGLGKQRLQSWRAQTKFCMHQDSEERTVTPQEMEPKLLASVGGTPVEMCVDRAHHRDGGTGSSPRHKPSWSFPRTYQEIYHRSPRPHGWVTSGQTATRREHNPTHQQLIGLKLYWVRPRFFHHQSLSSRSLHKTLSLIHPRADRRSKKKHSLTAAKTKTILQKANNDEKAENYVPDEGTR